MAQDFTHQVAELFKAVRLQVLDNFWLRGMADRAHKLRRLERLRRRVPHVSASALSAILNEVQLEMPELSSRHAIREARNAALDGDTPYGSIFTVIVLTSPTGDHHFDIVNPFALMYYCFLNCDAFRAAMDAALALRPSTHDEPWRLVFYCDEVTPGNQLAQDNLRKLWAFYFSFMEFGAAILSQEDAWFCLASIRSSRVNKAQAGIAQAFSALVKVMFAKLDTSFHRTGILLRRPDGTDLRFFARLGMILQDGGAHKSIWLIKGDAGLKMCMLCRNLVSEKSELVAEDGTDLLMCSIIHESEIDFASDADIRGSVRRLAAHRLTDSNPVFKCACTRTYSIHMRRIAHNSVRILNDCVHYGVKCMWNLCVHHQGSRTSVRFCP